MGGKIGSPALGFGAAWVPRFAYLTCLLLSEEVLSIQALRPEWNDACWFS